MTMERRTSNWSEHQDGTTTDERNHVLSRISPPPLKRQRSNLASDEAKPSALPSRFGSIRSEDSRSSVQASKKSYLSTSSGLRSGSEPHGHRHPAVYSAITSNSSKSGKAFVGSKVPSTSATSSKPECQVCMRGSFANYDPLITCSGCRRHYHDSCRKPSLAEGADAQQWRCFKCRSGKARRSSKVRSTDALVSHTLAIRSEKGDSGANTPTLATQSRDPVQVDFRPADSLKVERSIHQSNMTLPNHSLEKSSGSANPLLLKGPQARSDSASDVVPIDGTHAKTLHPDSASRDTLNGLQEKRSLQELLEFPRPRDAGLRHSQLQTLLGRTEIPNTPSQQSSLNKRQSLSVVDGAEVPEDMHTLELGLTPPEPSSSAKSAFSLCTVCLKQHVLANPGITQATCRKCLEQSRNAQHERSEIPETPEPAVHTLDLDTENLPSSSNPNVRSHDKNDPSSVPWFKSGLVSATPKVKRKKVRLGPFSGAAITHQESMEVEPKLCDDVESTKGNAEDAMLEIEQEAIDYVFGHETVRDTVAQGSSGTFLTEMRQQPVIPDNNNMQDDDEGEASRMSCSPVQPSSAKTRRLSPDAKHVSAIENSMSPEQERAAPSVSSRPSGSTTGFPMSRERLPPESTSQNSLALAVQKSYTVRELAQIALVAANGKRMTVSDVVSWMSSTFPKDFLTGAWEKSVQSAFSRFEEFHGDKPEGGKLRYNFSSKKTRRKYEGKFPAFLPLPSPPARTEDERVRAGSKQTDDRVQRKQRPRAVKTAERSRGLRSKHERMAHDSSVDRHDSSSEDTDEGVRAPKAETPFISDQPESRLGPKEAHVQKQENDVTFNPFKRKRPPSTIWVPQEHDNMHIRLTSFKEVYASPAPRSIDSMTEEEKAQKIAEIKARPSRKKIFGQENKLAHKRRHNLADIHDERDGAWKPPRSGKSTKQLASEKKPEARTNMDVDEDGPQTLRQLFNLPNNMIPMNDGHTELAFRDGTMVNGRLPRPRNVYRVGKMFGGELTVRTN